MRNVLVSIIAAVVSVATLSISGCGEQVYYPDWDRIPQNGAPVVYAVDKEFDFYMGKLCVKNIIREKDQTITEFTVDLAIDGGVIGNYSISNTPGKIASLPGVSTIDNKSLYVSSAQLEEAILRDGSEGYKFIVPASVYDDAVFTLDIRYLRGEIDSPETQLYRYTIDLSGFTGQPQ